MIYKNQDKMVFYSFWMTILIVVYHLAPHLIEMSIFAEKGYLKQFFETFGSIALNYFFAVSAYKFFVSEKSCKDKLKKRLITLIIPYMVWNTVYILLYILQKGIPDLKEFALGYTLTPFDGPLWYIFVLYIYFVFFSICIKKSPNCIEKLKWWIIVLTLVAAIFHYAVISSVINFPYDWWIERAIRMLPPFLYGCFVAQCGSNLVSKHNMMISGMISIASLALSTVLGDGAITILLLYICSVALWNITPNFTLKNRLIIRNDMFTIYALHEGIIVVVLALFSKANIRFENYFSLVSVMFIVTVAIIIIGFLFNILLRYLPFPLFNIMFTGGRNKISKSIGHSYN